MIQFLHIRYYTITIFRITCLIMLREGVSVAGNKEALYKWSAMT